MQTTNHRTVLEQNIRLHETEAYFYNATHPENFNVLEQGRLKRQVRRLANKVGPSLPVLDLASGTGNVSERLQADGLRTIACDLSLDMLKENRAEYRVRCDVTRLPFRDASFGAVTAYSVFHHLPDPAGAMREVGRVAAAKCSLYFDHDHFLPKDGRGVGRYPFTGLDLVGWGLWLMTHPKYAKRLFQYAFRGRKAHLRNLRGLDQAESHERVDPERLVAILEDRGFRVQLGRHRGGSHLEAHREEEPMAVRSAGLIAQGLRIVHLGTGFLPVSATTGRSVEETIYQITRQLAGQLPQRLTRELGAEVDVIDIRVPGDDRGEGGARFHEVRSLPLRGSNFFSYFLKVTWFSMRILPVLRRLIRNGNVSGIATVIHAHSQFPAAVALLARSLSRRKVTVVYTAHNPYLLAPASLANRLKHTLIEGWVLRRVDRVVAQTEAVGRELSGRFRIPPDRIACVFAGIDVEVIDDFVERHPRQENGHRTVLCPAIVNPRKNQMAVVAGMPEVVRDCPDCRFVFAGAVDDRAYFRDIQKVIAERGLSDYVEFSGHLPLEALYQQYRDATVVVFPTLYESQGKVLIEAMAFGLPVIASRIGPIEDVVSLREGSAILIDPHDTEEISRSIAGLLRDERMREALSTKGRELASSRFPWSRTARDMLTVYQEIEDTNSQQPEGQPWSR